MRLLIASRRYAAEVQARPALAPILGGVSSLTSFVTSVAKQLRQMREQGQAAALGKLERDEGGCGYGPQIECPRAPALLHALRPRDAFVVLGYTMEDITNTAKGFGFLFGEADLARLADEEVHLVEEVGE